MRIPNITLHRISAAAVAAVAVFSSVAKGFANLVARVSSAAAETFRSYQERYYFDCFLQCEENLQNAESGLNAYLNGSHEVDCMGDVKTKIRNETLERPGFFDRMPVDNIYRDAFDLNEKFKEAKAERDYYEGLVPSARRNFMIFSERTEEERDEVFGGR